MNLGELLFRQIVTLLVLMAVCARSYPIKVHDDNQYEVPQEHEQLVQYGYEPQEHELEVEHSAHPKYEFKYEVNDPHTQDIKEQAEKRDGHKVEGYYKLLEADGTTRTVHYTADKHTGFQAQVEKSGHSVHPVVHYDHQ